MKRTFRRSAWIAGLACAAAMSGCATVGDWLKPSPRHGFAARQQVMSDAPSGPTLMFEFIHGDDAGLADDRLGSGYIVVSDQGGERQSIEHAFEMPASLLDRQEWIRFEDLDGDGWMDFTVASSVHEDSGVQVTAAYRYVPGEQRFELAEPLSNLGDIQASGHACVTVRYAEEDVVQPTGRFCYSAQAGRWIQQVPVALAPAKGDEVTACLGATPDLLLCRKERMALDRQLLSELKHLSSSQRQVLAQTNGRQYASQFARSRLASHNAWLRYRDARCASHVREQAVPLRLMASAQEACRHDMALHQLQQFAAQHARRKASIE